MLGFDSLAQNSVMPFQEHIHLIRVVLCHGGAALDVGEQEGDGAGW